MNENEDKVKIDLNNFRSAEGMLLDFAAFFLKKRMRKVELDLWCL